MVKEGKEKIPESESSHKNRFLKFLGKSIFLRCLTLNEKINSSYLTVSIFEPYVIIFISTTVLLISVVLAHRHYYMLPSAIS